jgi:hypothetical protein
MYELLKVVNKRVAGFAAFVILIACAMQALTAVLYIAPLIVLQGGSSLSAFTTEQLQALAAAFLKVNAYAFDAHVAFFGLWCVLTGYLIFKSTFLPRIIGVLLSLSGFAWMLYIAPEIAVPTFPIIGAVSALGEVPLEFWLIFKSVNEARWREQAGARSGSLAAS